MTDEGIKSQALGSPEDKHLIYFGVSARFLEGVERELGPEQRSELDHNRHGGVAEQRQGAGQSWWSPTAAQAAGAASVMWAAQGTLPDPDLPDWTCKDAGIL